VFERVEKGETEIGYGSAKARRLAGRAELDAYFEQLNAPRTPGGAERPRRARRLKPAGAKRRPRHTARWACRQGCRGAPGLPILGGRWTDSGPSS